jgi:hypothetical protein
MGFSGRFCLNILMETGCWSPANMVQHIRRPQGP